VTVSINTQSYREFHDVTLNFAAPSSFSGVPGAGLGLLLLGHHVPWHPHRARIHGAAGADDSALHHLWSHPAGSRVFFECTSTHRARSLVHGAVWGDHHRHRHGLPGVRGAVDAERSGVGFHYGLALLDDRRGSADSWGRPVARTHHRRDVRGPGGHNSVSGSRSDRRRLQRTIAARLPVAATGLRRMGARFHPATPASNQGASRGERRDTTTGNRPGICRACVVCEAASFRLEHAQYRSGGLSGGVRLHRGL
jgi:hypothetical protein